MPVVRWTGQRPGRSSTSIASPWSDSAQFSEEVAELSEIGVGWISVLVEASTRAEWLDAVSSLAAVVTPTQ